MDSEQPPEMPDHEGIAGDNGHGIEQIRSRPNRRSVGFPAPLDHVASGWGTRDNQPPGTDVMG